MIYFLLVAMHLHLDVSSITDNDFLNGSNSRAGPAWG